MPCNNITTLDSLKNHLHSAMILEHATLPPYLTALYSIKPGTNQDAFNILRVVAVEEMLHLTIAANLLNSVGGEVNLTRKGFVPAYPAYLPKSTGDFKVHLEAFTENALDTFLEIERPIAPKLDTEQTIKRTIPLDAWCLSPDPCGEIQYATIGEFYIAIKEGIELLEEQAREKGSTIFVGNANYQITPEYYYSGGGKLFPVTCLDSAVKAINLVIEQGEGYVRDNFPTGVFDQDGEIAHYYRFQQIKLRRYYVQDDQPDKPSGPEIQVDWNAVYQIQIDPKLANYPQDSELFEASLNFNRAYAKFLKLLTRAYNGERELLTGEAVPAMFGFRNLMIPIIRNPIPNRQSCNAGPTFEIDAVWDELGGAEKF